MIVNKNNKKQKEKEKKKEENLSNSGLCHPEWPLTENQSKRKERQDLDFDIDHRKLWKLCCAGINPERLDKNAGGIENRTMIQQTTFRRSVRILRRVLDTWRDLLSLELPWKTIIRKNS